MLSNLPQVIVTVLLGFYLIFYSELPKEATGHDNEMYRKCPLCYYKSLPVVWVFANNQSTIFLKLTHFTRTALGFYSLGISTISWFWEFVYKSQILLCEKFAQQQQIGSNATWWGGSLFPLGKFICFPTTKWKPYICSDSIKCFTQCSWKAAKFFLKIDNGKRGQKTMHTRYHSPFQ